MKKIIIIFFAFFLFGSAFGQETLDKDYALSIKKNPEYFYAENVDGDVAFSMLMEKIRNCRDFDSPIDSTADFVRQKASNFRYKKNSHSEVTIYYVLKKDLVKSDNEEVVLIDTEKDSDVIGYILDLGNYQDLNTYLERRKDENHDVQFKLIRGDDGTRNCYWIIFDGKRNIIAILDRTLSKDLLTGQFVDYQKYVNYPKLWLQIF